MKKILIVDDDQDIINILEHRLRMHDYEVIEASDGQEGINKAKEEKPDLIIMDVMMPNMEGGDAVKVLKSDSNTKHIPVIFLTAVTQGLETSSINIDDKFYTSMAKPFNPDELLAEIEKMIGE